MPAARTQRRTRADAVANRARVLTAARIVFLEAGPNASLNEVAKRAGVGPGTLYRHFPTLQALLVAIVSDDVAVLCAQGRDLLAHDNAGTGLRRWLRAFAMHASTMRGLLATQLAVEFTPGDGNALAACHEAIRVTGAELLARAKSEDAIPADTDILDLLRLVNAIAWASQQSPGDESLMDRLLTLALR